MEIVMPRLSESMAEGKILHWAVKPGDFVTIGDVLGEVETDKANMELEATEPGYVVEILAPVGATVPVGAPLIRLAENLDEVAVAETCPNAYLPGKLAEEVDGSQDLSDTGIPSADASSISISPLAAQLAQEVNVDPRLVKGTGPGGRVMKDDVLRHVRETRRPSSASLVQSQVNAGTIRLEDVVPNSVLDFAHEASSGDNTERIAPGGVTCIALEKRVNVCCLWKALSGLAERLSLLPRPAPQELLPPCVGRAFVLALRQWKVAPDSFSPSSIPDCIAVSVGPSNKRLYPTVSDVCLLSVSELLQKFWERREQALAGALKGVDCCGASLIIESLLESGVKVSSAQLTSDSSPVVFLSMTSAEMLEILLAVRVRPSEIAQWGAAMQVACEILENPLLLAEGTTGAMGK